MVIERYLWIKYIPSWPQALKLNHVSAESRLRQRAHDGNFEKMAAKEGGIIVLSFQDSLLRKSDLGLLEEGRWINDKLIGFVFE